MADNVVLNSGSGGDTVAADDVAGVKYQVVKLAVGADGAAALVADANPIPISDAGGALTVDGTVAVTGVATAANQTTIIGHLDGVEGLLTTIDADTGALAAAVSGTEVQVDVVAALPAGTNNIGDVDVASIAAGDNNIGNVDIVTMPNVTLAAGTNTNEVVGDAAHDAAAAGNPLLMGGYASAAAPTDVSADGDAVRAWMLRSGAQAVQPTLGGVLATAGNGAAGTGVQRVTIASDSTGNIATIGTSITPGTGASHLGKAEDAAHASGDVGVMALAVRQNSQVDLGADGDYVPLTVDDSGGVRVSIVAGAGSGGTAAADDADFTAGTTQGTPAMGVYESSPTSVTDGDLGTVGITQTRAMKVHVASGGVSGIVDDAAFTPGTTEGVVFMAHADETTPDSVDEGDAGALRMTLARALHINVRDDAGDSCMDGTNNAVRVNIVAGGGSGGTAMTDDAAFTPGTTSITPMGAMFDDTTPDSVNEGDGGVVRMSANRNMYVTIRDAAGNERGLNVNASGEIAVASHAVTNAGTFAVQVSSIAAGTNNIGDVDVLTLPAVAGGAAQDAAITGNPVPVGMRASTATPTAMSADGDVVYPWATREGATVVAGAHVDDAAFTPGTHRVVPSGLLADETAPDSVDEGDVGIPRMSLDRKQYVIAHHETSTIYQNGTARTPAFAIIDAATSGDNTLLAAQGAGNKIRVHQLFLVAAGSVNVRFESGAAGTALSGQMNLVANTGFVLPYSPIGWFETAANTLLNLELSAAVSVDGNFAYTVVT